MVELRKCLQRRLPLLAQKDNLFAIEHKRRIAAGVKNRRYTADRNTDISREERRMEEWVREDDDLSIAHLAFRPTHLRNVGSIRPGARRPRRSKPVNRSDCPM